MMHHQCQEYVANQQNKTQFLLRSNVLRHHFYLTKVIILIQSGLACSMHLRHGTSLLSTPLPFFTCIVTLGTEK